MNGRTSISQGAHQLGEIGQVSGDDVVSELIGEYDEVRIDGIGATGPLEQVAHSGRVGHFEGVHLGRPEEPGQSGLPCPVPPDLRYDGCAGPQHLPPSGNQIYKVADPGIAAIDRDERPSVKDHSLK
ncbi:MAG: hypothetical protein OXH20_13755 [bacterium]|nr:hypothetical protein [bacterium]